MEEQKPVGLACMEVWGGNGRIAREVALPGLASWVYSEPLPGSEAGGDLYYLSACSKGQLARIAVADVSGHGAVVSRAAECLRELMRKHIDTWDQSELVQELNRSFKQEPMAERFATLVLLGFYAPTGELVFTNCGHPPPLWYRAGVGQWELLDDKTFYPEAALTGLPLGLIAGTNYLQTAFRLLPGDLLILYSDALSEASEPDGEQLGPQGLLELARRVPVDSARAAAGGLLAGVERYRSGQPSQDDQTVLVLQRLSA
ncbi:MAG: serine/threonine-protein phosphatase [Acidobacteria bacterium]|nr:serine/threonine-protein phosphatase [Acidobacteriota bacterium]